MRIARKGKEQKKVKKFASRKVLVSLYYRAIDVVRKKVLELNEVSSQNIN